MALLEKREKGEGLRAKSPFFLLSPEQNRGGGHTAAALAGTPGRGGGREVGEKNEESEGVLFPLLPRARVERGGAPTVAGGRRRWSFGTAALGGQGGRCVVVDESWGWRARWRAYFRPGGARRRGRAVAGR